MSIEWGQAHLQLKQALNWPAITGLVTDALRQSGRNLDGCRPGRKINVGFYPQILVLMLVLRLDYRKMEAYLAENAVGRLFIGLPPDANPQIRDHATLARLVRSVGAEGFQRLNQHIAQEAVRAGFAHTDTLSADTTAQELPFGHPHEAGILWGLAQRVLRARNHLASAGKRCLGAISNLATRIQRKCKEYHLFAKSRERKDTIIRQMVRLAKRMERASREITNRLDADTSRQVRSAVATLRAMEAVSVRLLPQILYWLKTGIVASGKILHAGLPKARVLVRNKAEKKYEFGLQYLVGAIRGGYLMVELIQRPSGETKMPARDLAMLRRNFGEATTPHLFFCDRDGSSKKNIEMLHHAGVKKIGIQPRGRAKWHVRVRDRKLVARERAGIEGKIGTLKSSYGMNKPRERRTDTVAARGPRSALIFNFHKFANDVTAKRLVA